MPNGRPGMRLGKLPRKSNAKTLWFGKYLLKDVEPVPPGKNYWEYKVPASQWGMLANDTVGDCTCAGAAHMIMNWTAHSGSIVLPSVDDVLAAYSAITGYVPGNESTDNGAAMTDVLAYWQGTGIAGHKIAAWAALDITNRTHFEIANYVFGGVYCGVNLPNSAMDQFQANEDWDVLPDDGGIDGGHCIPYFGYGSNGDTCVTWAKLQPSSWEWFSKYVEEAYAVVSQDWLDATGHAVNRLDLATLQADLQIVKA